jgi:hypothetical protein
VALLALAPAPLVGPELARIAGARSETVGALLTGTTVLSFALLNAAIPGVIATVNLGLFAFVIGTAIAGSVPTMRDALLPVLDGARYVALAMALGVGLLAVGPGLDARTMLLGVSVLVLGGAVAAIAAALFRGDPVAAALGAGSRDPAVAIGLAVASGLAGAAAVPLVYAAALLLALGLRRLVSGRP